MNETLKGVAHIGAELAAAKADLQREMERHRKTWRQLEQAQRERIDPFSVAEAIRKALDRNSCPNVFLVIAYEAAIEALSQQAEPASYGHIDQFGELASSAVSFSVPAPAQDEQQPIRLPGRREVKGGNNLESLQAAAWNAVLDEVARLNAAPIAQTEQQPEQWYAVCGDWRETSVAIHGERSGYIACGIPEDKAHAIIKAHNVTLSAAPSHAMDAKEE